MSDSSISGGRTTLVFLGRSIVAYSNSTDFDGEILPPPRRRKSRRDTDAARERLEALARTLDSAVRIPGTSIRIGADAALNLIPGLGTLAANGLAGYLIWEARRLGVPTRTLLRMVGNVGLDAAISAVPVLGWFGDVFWRANARNIALLRDHLDARM
jgi:hypothetical protein